MATVTTLPITAPPPSGVTITTTLNGATLVEIPASGIPSVEADHLGDAALAELWTITSRVQREITAWAARHLTAGTPAAPSDGGINTALLLRTLAHIEANPHQWYQATWRCETALCFAGWAVTLAGGRWLTKPGDRFDQFLAPEPDDPKEDIGTRGVHIRRRAKRLLGLDEEQADRLFASCNTLEDLREIVAELCGEAKAS